MMKSMRRMACLTLIVVAGIVGAANSPGQARADSYAYYSYIVATTTLNSAIGAYGPKTEAALISLVWHSYLDQQAALSATRVGQVLIDEHYPFIHLSVGEASVLTFVFVDTTTALAAPGPEVSSVVYEARLDPFYPDVFTLLGSSSDLGSNFSLPFVVSGFEPVIRATPYDSLGNIVVLSGVDGDNVAVGLGVALEVPEPASWMLLATGLSGFVIRRRMAKHRADRV